MATLTSYLDRCAVRRGDPRPRTHTSMMGGWNGSFVVADESKLHQLIALQLEQNLKAGTGIKRWYWLTERLTPVYRLFVDLDCEGLQELPDHTKVELAVCAQRAVRAYFPHGSRVIVCKADPKQLPAKDGLPARLKTGVHLSFRDYFVSSAEAMQLRESMIKELEAVAADMKLEPMNSWEDVVDANVYSKGDKDGSGLRLIGAHKAEKCSKCKGTGGADGKCPRNIDVGRPYLPLAVLDADGEEDDDMLQHYRDNLLDLVKDTAVRTQADKTVTEGYSIPEGAPIYEAPSKKHKAVAAPSARATKRAAEAVQPSSELHAALQTAIRASGDEYAQAVVTDVTAQLQARGFLVHTNIQHCQRINRPHASNRIWFLVTRNGVQQKCHDENCQGYASATVPLDADVAAVVFPLAAPVEALMDVLDRVPTAAADFPAAASAVYGAAARMDCLDAARNLVEARLESDGGDLDTFRAGLASEAENALWKSAAAAAPESIKKLRSDYQSAVASMCKGQSMLAGCVAPGADWTTQTIDEEYVPDAEDLSIDASGSGYLLALLSSMGSGKSTLNFKLLAAALQTGAVLWVSPRINYTTTLNADLERRTIPFINYRDKAGQLLQTGSATLISPQSLHQLRVYRFRGEVPPPVSLLVLDESESTLREMVANRTHGAHLKDNWAELLRCVESAKSIVTSDAFLTNRTLDFLHAVRKQGGKLVVNKHRPARGRAVCIVAHNNTAMYAEWKKRLLERASQGDRLYVVNASKKRSKDLSEELEGMGISVLLHTGDERNEKALHDVNKSWAAVQVVIVTSTITVGVDYSPPDADDRFDAVFLWGKHGCGLPRDMAQAVARARSLKASDDKRLYALVYCTDTADAQSSTPLDVIVARQQLLQKVHRGWTVADAAVQAVDAANEHEVSLSQAMFDSQMHQYIEESGFTVETLELPPPKKKTKKQSEEYEMKAREPLLPAETVLFLEEERKTSGISEQEHFQVLRFYYEPPAYIEDDRKCDKQMDKDEAALKKYAEIPLVSQDEARTLELQRKHGCVTDLQHWQVIKHQFLRYVPDESAKVAVTWVHAVDVNRRDFTDVYFNLMAETRGLEITKAYATQNRFAHQRHCTADGLEAVHGLMKLLHLKTSVDCARVPPETVLAAAEYLAKHEAEIRVQMNINEPSTKAPGDETWARWFANHVLGRWSGTLVVAVQVGKQRAVHWSLQPTTAAMGHAFGLQPADGVRTFVTRRDAEAEDGIILSTAAGVEDLCSTTKRAAEAAAVQYVRDVDLTAREVCGAEPQLASTLEFVDDEM